MRNSGFIAITSVLETFCVLWVELAMWSWLSPDLIFLDRFINTARGQTPTGTSLPPALITVIHFQANRTQPVVMAAERQRLGSLWLPCRHQPAPGLARLHPRNLQITHTGSWMRAGGLTEVLRRIRIRHNRYQVCLVVQVPLINWCLFIIVSHSVLSEY